jgi:O-antigen ligase
MNLVIVPIVLFFLFAVFSFYFKPGLAAFCILLATVANASFIEPPSIKIGLNMYLYDIVFIPLLLSALLRIVLKQEWRYVSPLWLGYGCIVLFEIIAGLKLYGTAAGVDGRNFFFYWCGALYFMTFACSAAMLQGVSRYWVAVCSLLLAIVYFRFVAEALSLPIAETWTAADPTGVRFRVINSSQAYLLGCVVIMLFQRYIMPESNRPSRILTVLFLVAVITLQHRSVWAVTVFGIAALFVYPGVKIHNILGKMIVLGLVGMILLTPLLMAGYADNFIESIGTSADRATHLNTGTFGSRRKAWEHIMDYWKTLGFMDQFLGEPFGGGYAGSKTSPHNMFFQSLLRTGIAGTVCLVAFYLAILLRLYWQGLLENSPKFYPALFFMLITAQTAYYIPYGAQPEHGILLGIAASLTKRRIAAEKPATVRQNAQYFLNTPDSENFRPIKSRGFDS